MTSAFERLGRLGSNEINILPQLDANNSDTDDEEICMTCIAGVGDDLDDADMNSVTDYVDGNKAINDGNELDE